MSSGGNIPTVTNSDNLFLSLNQGGKFLIDSERGRDMLLTNLGRRCLQ